MASSSQEYTARCHCGKVQGRFLCNKDKVYALDCNCTDCHMRQNVHVVVPAKDFSLVNPESYEDNTTLYQFLTRTAIRRFCSTCGVLPWYIPRSHPGKFAITIHCVDWTQTANGTKTSPPVIVKEKFDGVNWEDSAKRFNDNA